MEGDGTQGRRITGQLNRHEDLYRGIASIAQQHGISRARVTGSGSVSRAVLSTHDQKSMRNSDVAIDRPMEIVSMHGSLEPGDPSPLPRVHVVLSDHDGNGLGGLLLPDRTPVLSCSIVLEQT